jgi:hypothetical protein
MKSSPEKGEVYYIQPKQAVIFDENFNCLLLNVWSRQKNY